MGQSTARYTATIIYFVDFEFLVNVRGSFLMTKFSLPLMKKRNYGRILLIASIAGKEVQSFHFALSLIPP